AVRLVAGAMNTAQFDRARLAARASEGWITVTELADTLTRDHGVPFRTSHGIAAPLIAECEKRPAVSRGGVLRDVSSEVLGRAIEYDDGSLDTLLSARHFVEVRRTPGGPAPEGTARAIIAARLAIAADEKWIADTRAKLDAATRKLEEASA